LQEGQATEGMGNDNIEYILLVIPKYDGNAIFEPQNGLRMVLSIPQDGRIKLAFDLDWQLKCCEN
jgi:hypothetical protein